MRPNLPRNAEEMVRWYVRYVSPFALIAGFVADNLFFLRRVDLWSGNVLLFSYLAIAAACIVAMNAIASGRARAPWMLKSAPFIPVIAQFAFGGLFSGYLALYSRSAAYSVSWIFVIIVAALLLGNERFVRQYMKFSFQISIFFTALFSFLIFFLPVVFRQIGPYMFFVSGAVSLCAITLLLALLYWLTPEIVMRERARVIRAIAIIFIAFNILYIINAIPPLPLALKDAGIYHDVERNDDGTYRLIAEHMPWYEAYLRYNTSFHVQQGSSAYAFSAIFAPSGLSTVILHQWQRYDTSESQWVTVDTLRFPITGGRDGGYRGYSVKSGITPGKWRVNVITDYGQLIGRMSFTAYGNTSDVELEELEK